MSVGVTEMLLIVSGSTADDVSENVPFSIFSWKREMKNLPMSVQAGFLQKLVVSHLHTDRQTDNFFETL
jgi:hypothetical protein